MPQIFSLEEEVSRYIASCSVGEVREIFLPDGFPDDPQWHSWPGQLYVSIFEPGCPVNPLEGAQRTARALGGLIDSFSRDLLLPHLKHRPLKRRPQSKDREPRVLNLLYSLLQQGNTEEWVKTKEFIAAAAEENELKTYLDPDYAADYVYFETRGYYRNFLGDSGIHEEQRYLESPELYKDACLVPLVQNYLGAAALLGILEVRYGRSESPYTPWAGISGFRLTAWGEFVTGKHKKAPLWRPRRVLDFSAGGEIVSLRETSPEARKLLDGIGTEISPGIFRLGRGQILAAVTSHAELRRIIEQLISLAIEPLPPLWQDIFDSMDESVVRLEEMTDYLVFQVPEHKRFLSLLREDPSLGKLLVPAAGRKILVLRSDLPRLRRELKKRGLLLELSHE